MIRTLTKSRIVSVPIISTLPFRAGTIQLQHRTLTRSMPSKKDDKYTHSELHDEVKEESQAGNKGGAPRKQQGSHEGKQYVLNTSKAKDTRKDVSEPNGSSKADTTSQRTDYKSAKNCTEHWEDPGHLEKNLQAYKTFQEQNRKSAKEGDKAKKRSQAANGNSPNKKQKSSSKDEPLGAAGSITRVPKHGQKVQWHSIAGYVDGEVVEVVYEEKEVEGKKAKGSKEDPRVVLRSDASGKICVHKPDAVYFD
jgi:hypothetical protein